MDYPKMMITDNDDLIVFFLAQGIGFIVWLEEQEFPRTKIGLLSSDWDDSVFIDYTGIIELSNV